MNTLLLQGKVAVVTGANRGIGRAIVSCFRAHGCSVYACARQLDALPDIQVDPPLGADAGFLEWVALDLASEASIREASRRILADKRKIDVLVNNAGTASGALFQMTSMAEMRRTFEVNLFGPLQFSQGLARWMARQGGGSIINLASTAAFVADAGTLAYGSSKAALARATQSMATELGASGVRVNAIAQNFVDNPTYFPPEVQANPAFQERLAREVPLGRLVTAEEDARFAAYLCSDDAACFVGQAFPVCGGWAVR